MNNINQSKLTPPPIVFKIVWPILYLLMIISYILYIQNSNDISIIFFLQLFLNFLWIVIYFKFHQLLLSFIIILCLIIAIIANIISFYKINHLSAYLLLPYLFWTIFASYLNWYIFINN